MINKRAIKCVMCIALVRIEKSRVVLTFVRKINAVALVSRNRKHEKTFFYDPSLVPFRSWGFNNDFSASPA